MTAQPTTAPTSQDTASPRTRSTTCSGRSDGSTGALQRECNTFCRYLAGARPDWYVLGKYLDYHRNAAAFDRMTTFETLVVRLAAVHPWLARVADSYSARFDKLSPLRKKLALLLGILECSPGYFERIDLAWTGPRFVILLRMGVAVANSAAALAVSVPLLGPLHLAIGRRRGS